MDTRVTERAASYLLAVRLFMLVALLGSALLLLYTVGYDGFLRTEKLSVPMIALLAFTALSAMSFRIGNGWSGLFLYAQLIVDSLLVTGVVYVTGGPASPFLFLYLPLVMVSAIFFSRRLALISTLFASAIYGGLVWLMMEGAIAPFSGEELPIAPTGGVQLQWLGITSAMVLISIATSFLVLSLSRSREEFAQSRSEFDKLLERQQAILQGIPDAVMTTDNAGGIVLVNESFQRLFRLRSDAVIGKSAKEILARIADQFALEGELRHEEGDYDISFHFDGHSGARQFRCRVKRVNEGGTVGGRLFLFEDVTRLRSAEEQLALQERMARVISGAQDFSPSGLCILEGFVGESRVMRKVFSLIEKVSASEATVLVSGESGTGKELVARAIHLGSPRSVGAFVPVNCGAIPENLLESELFGHKRGAFTGAVSDHLGLFRQADGGTIFLDEIGELPLHLQAKLLRAIQDRSVRPVGADESISVDTRIIAATNKNLRVEVDRGNFRDDLFYRLNVIAIHLPALRERKDDIPLLTHSILSRLKGDGRLPVTPAQTMTLLMNYSYPGNVRELENVLERACVLGGEAILPEHLPEAFHRPESSLERKTPTEIFLQDHLELPVSLDDILMDIERRYLHAALLESRGMKKKAAQLLGMNFRSFRYRLQKFDISDEDAPRDHL